MKKGFTLIELLIVITIIGILAVAFLPSLLGAPAKARDTQRVADVQHIAGVLTTATITGTFAGGCIQSSITNATALPEVTAVYLDTLIKAEDFGGKVPADPQSNVSVTGCTGYAVLRDNSDTYSFAVVTRLENPTGNLDQVDANTCITHSDYVADSFPELNDSGNPGECFVVYVQ